MLPEEELARILPTLPRITVHGPWTRAIGYHLLQGPPPGEPVGNQSQPLWAGGPKLEGARFTPKGGFASVYLASDPVTALTETKIVFLPPHLSNITVRFPPYMIFTVEGVIPDVLDLTSGEIQKVLGTTLQELTGSWAIQQEKFLKGIGSLPPTQILGRAAHSSGVIFGLKYESAKNAGSGHCFVIFPECLSSGFLEIYDPGGILRDRYPKIR